ncbi:hypothetical protein GX586_15560, partial [bacterium]|nr:hypothetical protein [bacterium]
AEGKEPSTGDGGYSILDVPVGKVQRQNLAAWVRVKARVKEIHESTNDRTPYRLILEEGNDTVTVTVYRDKWAGLMQAPTQGSLVRVLGVVKEYKGEKQINVLRPANIEIIQ